jgi:hypothetical protein
MVVMRRESEHIYVFKPYHDNNFHSLFTRQYSPFDEETEQQIEIFASMNIERTR